MTQYDTHKRSFHEGSEGNEEKTPLAKHKEKLTGESEGKRVRNVESCDLCLQCWHFDRRLCNFR